MALWKATLIDGLGNGAAAVLYAFHRSLTDGIGGADQDDTVRPSEHPRPQSTPPPEPKPPGLAWPLGTFVGSVPGLILDGIRQPLQTIRSAAANPTSRRLMESFFSKKRNAALRPERPLEV